MNSFNYDEMTLLSIYSDGTRKGTIHALQEMRGYLEADERELRKMTDAALGKLALLSDRDFDRLDLFPEFEDGEEGDSA